MYLGLKAVSKSAAVGATIAAAAAKQTMNARSFMASSAIFWHGKEGDRQQRRVELRSPVNLVIDLELLDKIDRLVPLVVRQLSCGV